VRVGVGAQQGNGINRAQARSGAFASNTAQWRVRVTGGVFTTEACVLGKIFVDCNGNHVQDAEEIGIPGVRLYFQDGTYLVSDSEGKYSMCNLLPRTHVLKVDPSTLPRGSRLTTSSNRNAGDANSLFLDLRNGELHRADFIEGSCAAPVLEQVQAAPSQGRGRGAAGREAAVHRRAAAALREQTPDPARRCPCSALIKGVSIDPAAPPCAWARWRWRRPSDVQRLRRMAQTRRVPVGVPPGHRPDGLCGQRPRGPHRGRARPQRRAGRRPVAGGADRAPVRRRRPAADRHALRHVEASGGRLQLPGARTDELGPGRLDADRVTVRHAAAGRQRRGAVHAAGAGRADGGAAARHRRRRGGRRQRAASCPSCATCWRWAWSRA
jgi:hypothetical protein